jgi:nicotinamide riboside kinase
MKKLLINVFGGPSIGKTTIAAELFVELKKNHVEVELVSEFPKDVVVEERPNALEHQWYITGTQAYRIHTAYKCMQAVITDSPILLGPVYDVDASPALLALSLEHHEKYNNLNIMLTRSLDYEHSMAGRVHSLTQSVSIDNRIMRFLDDQSIPYVMYDEYGKERIVSLILKELGVGHGR